MAPILALSVLLGIYAAGELVAQKTKAVFSTVLVMAFLLLIGFWSGLLPQSVFADAGVDKMGNTVAGMLIVSLGTTMDFPELRRQIKVVIISLCGVVCAVVCIILLGGLLGVGREAAIAGSPIFAGGSAATLIMTTALKEKGLETLSTFCIALYVMQKFIGIPITSFLLRRDAKAFLQNPEAVKLYTTLEPGAAVSSAKSKAFQPLRLPKCFERPSVYLTKLALVAMASFYLSALLNNVIHYFVMCLILGVLFFALGFLDQNILPKTQANGLITFLVTVVIFSNLATTTPAQVAQVFFPLLITAVCGVLGILFSGFVLSRLLKVSFGLAVSLGLTCTFGFPTTMLMPQEIGEAVGSTPKEKAAIENYLLPKMLTAGFVTVTITSVVIAGVVVKLL